MMKRIVCSTAFAVSVGCTDYNKRPNVVHRPHPFLKNRNFCFEMSLLKYHLKNGLWSTNNLFVNMAKVFEVIRLQKVLFATTFLNGSITHTLSCKNLSCKNLSCTNLSCTNLSKTYGFFPFCPEESNFQLPSSINIIRSSVVRIYVQTSKLKSASEKKLVRLEDLHYVGCGFIYDKKGLIVTAAHLILPHDTEIESPLDEFFVRDDNDLWYAGKVKAISEETDVAIVDISAPKDCYPFNLPYLDLEKYSEHPETGNFLFSYGATENAENKITVAGMVSEPYQIVATGGRYRFIQIAMITLPGMSGSPIFDLQGNLKGMIIKKFEGFGLAIPISTLSCVVRSLHKNGFWTCPFIGVLLKELPKQIVVPIKNHFSIPNTAPWGAPNNSGVLVHHVEPKSPAERAGLKKGDVIKCVNGALVNSAYDVLDSLPYLSRNILKLSVDRDGVHLELNVRPE